METVLCLLETAIQWWKICKMIRTSKDNTDSLYVYMILELKTFSVCKTTLLHRCVVLMAEMKGNQSLRVTLRTLSPPHLISFTIRHYECYFS